MGVVGLVPWLMSQLYRDVCSMGEVTQCAVCPQTVNSGLFSPEQDQHWSL